MTDLTNMIIQQLESTQFDTARGAGYTIKGLNNLLKVNGVKWRDVIKGEAAEEDIQHEPERSKRKDLSPLSYAECDKIIKEVYAHTRTDESLMFHDSMKEFLAEHGGLTNRQVAGAKRWIGRAFQRYR